jgi:hypothetical protein
MICTFIESIPNELVYLHQEHSKWFSLFLSVLCDLSVLPQSRWELLGHYTVRSDNSLPIFQDNWGCVITQKNAVLIFLSELFFFQEKILEELQTVHQQLCSVGKLEKLQNTNKIPLFLTWPSERYGKLLLCYLFLYEWESFFNDWHALPRGWPSQLF